MKLANTKKYLDIFVIIALLILIVTLSYHLVKTFSPDKQLSRFEDTPMPTKVETKTASGVDVNNPPEIKGCTADKELIDYCTDAINCCSGSSGNNKCFCEHPLVKQCKAEYDKCMADPEILKVYDTTQRAKKCSEQLKGCCIPFKDFKVDTSTFNLPVKGEQKADMICSTLMGLPGQGKQVDKCMALCQSNADCKAFSVNDMTCSFFSTTNMMPPKINALTGSKEPGTKTDYYSRKSK